MTPKEEYSRADVRRKFGLSERQLRGWERQRLIPEANSYTFSDLVAFQTLIKLRENKISAKEIFRALESLREKLEWVKQPLSELQLERLGEPLPGAGRVSSFGGARPRPAPPPASPAAAGARPLNVDPAIPPGFGFTRRPSDSGT